MMPMVAADNGDFHGYFHDHCCAGCPASCCLRAGGHFRNPPATAESRWSSQRRSAMKAEDAHLAPGELEDLFRSFRRSVFRLETLDDYSEGLEDEGYRSWSHGNAPPPIDGHWWYDHIVRGATSRQKRWDRVHMLRQPLSLCDYLRYSFEYGYTRSDQAGERCHILEV